MRNAHGAQNNASRANSSMCITDERSMQLAEPDERSSLGPERKSGICRVEYLVSYRLSMLRNMRGQRRTCVMTYGRDSAKLRAMRLLGASLLVLLLSACDGGLWNNPYPAADDGKSILYTAFTERPKHLDPAQAYSENEYEFSL